MSELRSEWTSQQAQENLEKANESLPEAQTTDRFRTPGRVSGVDIRAGEDLYEENTGADAGSNSVFTVPADPPKRSTDQGDQ